MRNALTITIGAVAGFALGYVICRKQLEQSYQDRSNSEIADLKEYYEKRMKKEVSKAVGIAVKDYEAWLAEQDLIDERNALEAKVDELASEEIDIETETNVMASNVAVAARAIVDYTGMSKATPRPAPAHAGEPADPDTPYQMTSEDFFSSTSDNEQVTLTYYSEDGVLATQQDQPLEGEERTMVVGDLLEKYVPVTGEESVLYVCSPKLQQEFEILRVVGSFSKEVLGLGDDTAS